MTNINYFDTELAYITDEGLKDFVKFYLENYCPPYFWEIGASASGKFHPDFTHGIGGLVRHTKAVCAFCEELLRMSQWAYMTEDRKNYARVACILHDTCKYGMDYNIDKSAYSDHAELAATNVNCAWQEFFEESAPFELVQAIRSHMGQWSTNKDNRPFTPIDRLVHMADYVASRSFITIPSINEDWGTVEIALRENDLPF